MRYENVCIEGIGYALPERVVTSQWIEEQLEPLYEALGLSIGFLEAATGIKERRWWSEDVKPSDAGVLAARKALGNASVSPEEIEVLVNASIMRDHLEPATAVIMHHKLGLLPTASCFDVSNACVSFLTGMCVVANMIELGQISTGLVVSGECFTRGIMSTLDSLLKGQPSLGTYNENLTTLTMGSGAAAVILKHKSGATSSSRFIGSLGHCQSNYNELSVAEETWSKTRATKLLRAGLPIFVSTWETFRREVMWERTVIDWCIFHQASRNHREQGIEALRQSSPLMRSLMDYPIFERLGNIGSASVPASLALAVEDGAVKANDRICLLSVGSGITSLCLGIEW